MLLVILERSQTMALQQQVPMKVRSLGSLLEQKEESRQQQKNLVALPVAQKHQKPLLAQRLFGRTKRGKNPVPEQEVTLAHLGQEVLPVLEPLELAQVQQEHSVQEKILGPLALEQERSLVVLVHFVFLGVRLSVRVEGGQQYPWFLDRSYS
jgi:hypothetical protein